MSNRSDDWDYFSDLVYEYIEDYTVPQYGDLPDDHASGMTPEDCMVQIKKYISRFGKNARGEAEQERDLFKIAHYAQICWEKMFGNYATYRPEEVG